MAKALQGIRMVEVTSFHNGTAFPLEGRHQTVACESCHRNNEYAGTPKTCYECHWVRRKDDVYQRVWGAAEALSRQEAIWAGSIWAAEQICEGDELGTIEPGKEADLLVIDKDYMTIPADDFETIQVLLTMVGGKVVHEVGGAL